MNTHELMQHLMSLLNENEIATEKESEVWSLLNEIADSAEKDGFSHGQGSLTDLFDNI